MRNVKYTKRFRRDYRREQSGIHSKKLDALLMDVVNLLAADAPLPPRNSDHALSGEWTDHRDCHLRPDLVLIYRKPDAARLELVRLGSQQRTWLVKTLDFPQFPLSHFSSAARAALRAMFYLGTFST